MAVIDGRFRHVWRWKHRCGLGGGVFAPGDIGFEASDPAGDAVGEDFAAAHGDPSPGKIFTHDAAIRQINVGDRASVFMDKAVIGGVRDHPVMSPKTIGSVPNEARADAHAFGAAGARDGLRGFEALQGQLRIGMVQPFPNCTQVVKINLADGILPRAGTAMMPF